MKSHARLTFVLAIALVVAVALVAASAAAADSNLRVIATGLDNPRGLTFGPNGTLYVALGGRGGNLSTTPAQCQQVPVPIGPYKGGFTSGIVKVGLNGTVTPFVTGLPSSTAGPGFTSGVADVKFLNGTLYAMTAGAGCSHGLFGTSNEILRVNPNGTTAPVANLSAWSLNHPVAQPEEDDFEPDGTWYSMTPFQGDFYAVEPNHGEVVQVDPHSGAISRVVDVSASQGHIVPTAIAHFSLFDNLFGGGLFRNLIGNFTVGNLNTFPVDPGSSQLMQVNVNGSLRVISRGYSTILGLVYDSVGNLYVLESMTAPGFPGPQEAGTGTIVKVSPVGFPVVVATGLTFPTGMTMGPDGALYVSNLGFAGPGAGQIVRVDLGRASLP
jgi:hypothetical protein